MKRFSWKIVICVVPVLLAGAIVAWAYTHNSFKLGVDLVGGTILVYEVDESRKLKEYQPEQLAASIKRRIDPTDLYNVTVRPVGATRVEIILPTGGVAQETEQTEETEVRADGKRTATAEEVARIKALIAQVGSLEFRILANSQDDDKAIADAEEFIKEPKNKDRLDRLAREGKAPPGPTGPTDGKYDTAKGRYSYSWVELDRQERATLGLNNASANSDRNRLWKEAAEARANNRAVRIPDFGGALLYSRPAEDRSLSRDERERKKFEYFILTRDPESDPLTGRAKAITGDYLVSATEGMDEKLRPAVHFRFNSAGGELFREVTSKNLPEGSKASPVHRYLAIILDGKIVSAPSIISTISTDGQISGNFTRDEVVNLVNILRSGALPATLKPQPVSENTMGATLGSDTIRAGTVSLVLAFLAVLAFMMLYYRFAGIVACVALLANLLLTVGFMVLVNATFTLPGLAGLVLMLGMAVDANVLIYERLREERDRGASLALALRNGYDRSFPTIIDTHLSSLFTAIVLYVMGNDQLKGFGISLTVGLIISFFTSLYMTRLIFDIGLAKNWLRELGMFRLFARPSIDFMAVRHYWFTATLLLTVVGIAVFLFRGSDGLNIDFTGGTAYGGQLVKPVDISELRDLIDEERQKQLLQVQNIKPLDTEGRAFEIIYADGVTRKVGLPNAARPEDLRQRASRLPDLSVEQIFLSSPEFSEGNKSRFFTIRTSEKAPELVQATIDRLLGDLQKKIELKSYQIEDDRKAAVLEFTEGEYASPAQVTMLLEREFRLQGLEAQAQQFVLVGRGEPRAGRFTGMRLELTDAVDRDKLTKVLEATRTEFAARPQPERLENFDSQLAAETQLRALYAILASWAAILVYVWFRFGNWTFGLAAVLCLVHDVF
ncbi:MAG: protein translocase subunit SecD, partial [Gemmataceae bacterium]|nr:protein translocase subunit SecD [Gemmataceae bacterium]